MPKRDRRKTKNKRRGRSSVEEQEEDEASVKKREVDARIEMQFDPLPTGFFFYHYGTTGLKLVVLELT